MKVLILFVPSEKTPYQESITEKQIERTRRALEQINHTVAVAEYMPDSLQELLAGERPDIIYNLVYGYKDGLRKTEFQPDSAEQIEKFNSRLVGSSSRVQKITQDKRTVGELLRGRLLSPEELTFEGFKRRGVGVLKPRYGAFHRGVRVTHDWNECVQILEHADEEYLLQEYVDGEEFTVGVLSVDGEPRCLVPFHIQFKGESNQKPHILDRKLYQYNIVARKNTPESVKKAALKAFTILGLHDYARFDIRLSKKGPMLLDANSLPNLNPAFSLFPAAALNSGYSYEQLVCALTQSAIRRYHGQISG